MKHWTSVICLFMAVAAMSWVRRQFRDRVISWTAARAGSSRAGAGSRASAVHAGAFAVAAVLLALGLWVWHHGGTFSPLRYVAGFVVLGGYVPFATLGAPKLTKWQKSHEQRLVDAGAARGCARAWDSVARVFSVLGAVLGFGAVFLLVAPA